MSLRKTTFILLFALIPAWTALAQVERVEPPSWWTGMKHSKLQLMVHGKDIGKTSPSLSYPGIRIESVSRVENPNYLFVDLVIDDSARPGTFPIRFTGEGVPPSSWEYTLNERDQHASDREGFNSSDVIYLLMPDRFANGNPDNDAVKEMKEGPDRKDPSGRHGGDIEGIIDHLDYLQGMGFTALWPNPLLENNQPRTSYHGYAMTDFYRVDPRFGTNEDYRRLGIEARKRGIKLIMDMVANHCGSEHWWMKDMPMPDWINYYPDYVQTNHRRTTNQDPYASAYDKERMTRGWFVRSMPDLNQQNPFLATYLIQNTLWWVEYLGLQGIRMDTYPYPDKYFMSAWCQAVLEEYPHMNIVGEEWSYNPIVVSYWQKGKDNPDGYRGYLPSVMDFPMQQALYRALTEKETFNSGMGVLYEVLANDPVYPDPDNLVIFADNHDMPRFFMQVGMDADLTRMAMAYILITRGIPQIYYGTEILMSHPEGDNHEYIRKDFPGGWPGDRVNAFTGQGLGKDAADFQQFMNTLLNWRKGQEVIHQGKLLHFAPEDGVYVLFRYTDKQKVMLILNKNEKDITLDMNRFSEIILPGAVGQNVLTGEKINLGQSLKAPAKSPLILEFND